MKVINLWVILKYSHFYFSLVTYKTIPAIATRDIPSTVFKHPVALLYLHTQYNSVNNATSPMTPSSHDMYRPQTTILRCLRYTKIVPLSIYSQSQLQSTHKEEKSTIIRRSERHKDVNTTTGLRTENNTITLRPLQYKNPKRGVINYIGRTSGRRPWRCKKEFYKV
jgi:hypothetical protein